ncbi:hypothetical protein ABZ897_51080 [Nonomuraea sp. NPDC046802]|uniref:hypothetical protein n=1 Tax=Nonomuraea sp. NPDC046802 TaxID=3154919 RepID=UPI0033C2EDB8
MTIGIEEFPTHTVRWLTLTCPMCGVQPVADDTEHQNVGWFVGIACNGMRAVNPERIGIDGTGWPDWTTAPEVVNEMDHGDLLGFLSRKQIEDAEKAYRLLIEADMSGRVMARIVVKIEPITANDQPRHQAVCRTSGCTLGVDGGPWADQLNSVKAGAEEPARILRSNHRNPNRRPVTTCSAARPVRDTQEDQ